eukprot:108189_1
MLRQRDNTKNNQLSNSINSDDSSQSSTTRKYGLFGCIIFALLVAYYVFSDNSSSSSSSDLPPTNSLTNQRATKTAPAMASKSAVARLGSKFGQLRPKVLSDLNPADSAKLERLMKREDKIDLRKKNKLNNMFG